MKKVIFNLAVAAITLCAGFNVNAQVIRTVIGNDTLGHTGDGGPAVRAQIGKSWSSVQDHSGNIYIADDEYNYIRKISPAGVITTIAGTGYPGYTGDGGAAIRARLNYPSGLAIDKYDNIYVADNGNFAIRKITPSGVITTVVGDGSGMHAHAGDGGPATDARLAGCVYVAVDKAGCIYIGDGNARVRKVDTAGIINTIAGCGSLGYFGNGIAATSASLSGPSGIAVDTSGNVFFADQSNMIIRKVSTSGIITNYAGTPRSAGFTGDGGAATSARLNAPGGVAVDTNGNVYFADQGNNRIRKVDVSGIITTIAGNGSWAYSGDGGAPTAASLKTPTSLCVGNNNNIFITDRRNFVVREIRNRRLVAITPSAGTTICAGTTNVFSVPELCHDLGLINEWKLNGTTLGIDSNRFVSSTLNNGDVISYRLIDPVLGFTIDSANDVTMTVNATVMPSVTLTKSTGDTICSGNSVTYTAHPVNGGSSASYNWMVNGINVASGLTYTYHPVSGDTVSVSLTSSLACPVVNPVLSSGSNITVRASMTPAVTIVGASGLVCPGTVVTYNAMGINTGSAPTYQWKKFGVNVGTGNTYSYTPANGDYLTCDMTSSATCATVSTVSSSISAVVNPVVNPSVDIVAVPSNHISAPGQLVTFYSEVTYGGTGVTYQWYVNGTLVTGATASSFSENVNPNDSVACVINSTAPCAAYPLKKSNTVIITGDDQLSANNLSAANKVYLYPNPNNGNFTVNVDVSGLDNQEIKYQIFDVTGKLIQSSSTVAQQHTMQQQINLGSEILSGNYLLKVSYQNGYQLLNFVVNK